MSLFKPMVFLQGHFSWARGWDLQPSSYEQKRDEWTWGWSNFRNSCWPSGYSHWQSCSETALLLASALCVKCLHAEIGRKMLCGQGLYQ